jgi:hypothetical protein
MRYLAQALINLTRVGVQFNVRGNTYTDIIWLDETDAIPSEEATMAERQRLIDEYDSQDYGRKRKAAYPDIYDYMDGIVKNDQTQIDKYIADSQAVKARYPKGA